VPSCGEAALGSDEGESKQPIESDEGVKKHQQVPSCGEAAKESDDGPQSSNRKWRGRSKAAKESGKGEELFSCLMGFLAIRKATSGKAQTVRCPLIT